jgi:hypothetical protein
MLWLQSQKAEGVYIKIWGNPVYIMEWAEGAQ